MDPEDDLPEEGEFLEIEDDSDVEDTEDGGAIVRMDDEEEDDKPSDEFLENLAETLPESTLKELASTFLEFVSRDKEARSKRDEQYDGRHPAHRPRR